MNKKRKKELIIALGIMLGVAIVLSVIGLLA